MSLNSQQIEILKNIYNNRDILDVNSNLKNNKNYNNYLFLTDTSNSYKNNFLDRLFAKYSYNKSNVNRSFSYLNTNNAIININFLRKERLYTKLKYSRSPAYDIVSGGSAALLAAFLGFLISEKYGFELVDSGDFYYLFMYIVFLSFSVRPIVHTLNSKDSWFSILSIKPLIVYFINLLQLVLKIFKNN